MLKQNRVKHRNKSMIVAAPKMLLVIMGGLLCLAVMSTTPMQSAKAQECCSCPLEVENESRRQWEGPTQGSPSEWPTVPRLENHATSELTAQRVWMISVFWEDNVLPALMLMSEQLTAVAVKQAQIIGSFIDAKHQMETQQVIQKMRAQAHKDYQPSVGMCEFGTGIKSLAASERRGEYNAFLLSQRAQDRHLGNAFTSARTGLDADRENRLDQFKETYCDEADNNNGLESLCGGSGQRDRRNKDIDFSRTVGFPLTMEVDYTRTAQTNDEEDLFALSSNLYGHEILSRPDSKSLESEQPRREGRITTIQKHYMDARAIVAKRSVAENSFNAIAGMKSEGTEGSEEFLKAILNELGISDEGTAGNSGKTEADLLLGDRPSYYAQMEVLGKKIYQNPDFYTNLYDKPANVERKKVAMQAIGLMQKFDLFKSYLRHEASMSVLLELAVMDLQDEIENEINDAQGEGIIAR